VEHDDDDDDDDNGSGGSHALMFVAESDSVNTKKDECFTPFESCRNMIEVEVSHVVSLCAC
jgi:hypothetical protein